MNLIVTRHRGAVDWLSRRGLNGQLIDHASGEEGQPGDSVFGVLPIDYAERYLHRGLKVFFIALPAIKLEKRKGDLTADEMDTAGARLYRVKTLELEPMEIPPPR